MNCTIPAGNLKVADIDSESDENPKLARKIQMKAILAIFKPLHKDKNLAFCHVELQYESIVIIFKIQYKFDVTVLHKVHLLDMEFWQVNYPNDSMNQVTGTGHCFSQVLSNFQLNNDDLGLEVMHHKVVMRNYDVDETNVLKCIRSQYVLNAIDFVSFKIGQPTNITCSLKPFRAAVQFAEHFNLKLILNFETAGKPVVLIIKNPTFEVHIVMATVSSDGSTQSSISTTVSSIQKKVMNTKKHSDANLTIEDRIALENVDWNDEINNLDEQSKPKLKPALNSLFNNQLGRGHIQKDNDIDNRKLNMDVEDDDIIELSQRSKRIKTVFERCYESTFREENFDYGKILVANSDAESD
ncbi:cell cycle checkpoint control protein RAD9A isoform X2 [Agrilus planipennis]|uniref:Cell cycle checkpoint control protein RAD9A isoform X2 n=1 Tax=Agrilus planipennis TaxID=224129 RepID=A0A1W4XCS4_AGRPL|nr:cell cycle checkpoint control protein RAD9A isoform X2 [Agrilus planipennis]